MKHILTLIFFIISTLAFGQKTKFNIKYSEQLAVFVFMQNITENYGENVFKTVFQKSKFNTDYNNDIISTFDKLSIDYSYCNRY